MEVVVVVGSSCSAERRSGELVYSRCWRCACDITAAVPFEYYDYKFCSVACLKEYRQSSSTVPVR